MQISRRSPCRRPAAVKVVCRTPRPPPAGVCSTGGGTSCLPSCRRPFLPSHGFAPLCERHHLLPGPGVRGATRPSFPGVAALDRDSKGRSDGARPDLCPWGCQRGVAEPSQGSAAPKGPVAPRYATGHLRFGPSSLAAVFPRRETPPLSFAASSPAALSTGGDAGLGGIMTPSMVSAAFVAALNGCGSTVAPVLSAVFALGANAAQAARWVRAVCLVMAAGSAVPGR